jgi:DNA transformation protein
MISDLALMRIFGETVRYCVPTPEDTCARDHLLAALDGLPVRARAMFGGIGLYMEDAFFCVISEGRTYFRTDDESRSDYTSRGMEALQPRHRPRGKHTVDRNFEVPPDVLSDTELLREWAQRAAAARR